MPGWKNSTRRMTLPPEWAPVIRPRILARDRYQCQWSTHGQICGQPAREVDHIGDRHDHRDENLRALCTPHHQAKSSSEGGKASAKKKPKRVRPSEPHPGMIAKRGS